MSLRFRYSDPRGIDEPAAYVTLGSNIRFGEGGFALSAELAEAAVSGATIEDPGGLYDFAGLRAFEVAETSAASNNQIIGRFVIADQTIGRSKERALLTGADRLWSLDLADYNWHAGKRVLVDQDSKRPEETAGDRLRWLINDAAHINLNDYGHVTYPTKQCDAADFRLQRPLDVLADCAVEGGYLFWVDYNEAHGKPELFFIDPDSTDYASTIYVSNVDSDVDGSIVFYPYRDAQLVRTPRPIAFGVAVPYEGGFVYVRNDTVGQQFAKQDQVAPMANVKKPARARRIANRFLNQYDEQSERIHFSIKVPWSQVNDVRHGHLLTVKFQHLPGYTDWTGVRVLRKFVYLDPEGGADYALLSLEAVPVNAAASVPVPAAGGVMVGMAETWPEGSFWSANLEASDDGTSWTEILTASELAAAHGVVVFFPTPLRHAYWRVHLTVNWTTVFMNPSHFAHHVLIDANNQSDLLGNGWTPGGTDDTGITSDSTTTFAFTGNADGFSMFGSVGGTPTGDVYESLTIDQTGNWGINQTDIINNTVRTLHYYWTWTLA